MKRLAGLAVLLLASCSPEGDAQSLPLDEARQDRRCAERVAFYQPPSGVVSNEAIAKEVAFAYLRRVYPEDDHLRPMTAHLRNGVWHVLGYMPEGMFGGVAHIELCQSNGRVLIIYHEQ